ncbi:MAG: right-handed parallel beta-helix repeat-containing protein [Anaerolineales bacterium]|nr:right-handed parallel beta-helix repeat-containing protein [Anaerolineales bacterium]
MIKTNQNRAYQNIQYRTMIVIFLTITMVLVAGCGEQAQTSTPVAVTVTPTLTEVPPTPTVSPVPSPTKEPCIPSGDQTDINKKLRGPGAIAVLCPGAVFNLTSSVVINADRQQIYTEGLPTDDRRAVLRIASPNLTTAIVMRDYSDVVLSNVIVDGNRPELGYKGGDALIYAGGFAKGQVIRSVKIMETRSWSSLHLIQGHSTAQPCSNALVEDNEIGPAGSSDTTWADGISLACMNTIVRNNLIVDATDGGIVIFGAPGSIIEGNTIRAETRTLLGGINMVDFDPYEGDYTGTIVRNNSIDASGAVIRIGLGMGVRVWGCWPADTDKTLHGGVVEGNTLRGTKMQYGFVADGVRDWQVTGNMDDATHSGRPSVDCGGRFASVPAGFQYYPPRAEGTFQPEFAKAFLDLALWAIKSPQPGE